ncbi:MAG: F0F1 ATP synthase subunit B [Evtepia sp.]
MLSISVELVYTIINIIVLFLLLRRFLFRPVVKIMEERENLIRSNITGAEEQKAESDRLLETAQLQVSGAAQEAERVAEERLMQAKRDQEKLILEAQAESERLIQNGKKQAELERQKVLSDARAEVVGLAMDTARKIAGSNPNEEQASGLFRDLLDKVGDGHE